MPSIKPFVLIATSLLYTTFVMAQPATDTLKNTVRKKGEPLVVSCNVGVFSFPKNYSTININLPYTVTAQQGGNTQHLAYTQRIAHYFTKVAATVEILHFEVPGPKHGIDFSIGFSPTYENSDNKKNTTFFLSAGYQWLIPLSKKAGNNFILKPCIGAGVYGFNVGFDSTIDNEKKAIAIAGQTYSPTFTYTSGARSHNEHTVNARYLELFYQNSSVMLIPQVTLARQNKDRLLYYSLTVGWAQHIAGDGGHVVIIQHGDDDRTHNRTTAPVENPYHFSGPIAKVGIGFYFVQGRKEKRQQRQRMMEMMRSENKLRL